MSAVLHIGVWEPFSGTTWAKVRELRTWTSVNVEPRHQDPGVWSLAIPYDIQAAALSHTCRLTFDLERDGVTTRLLTGVPTAPTVGADETAQVTREISGVGALALLGDVQCWPNPSQALEDHTVTHYTATGATETVLRNLINANVITRRGDDVIVAASLGRGKTITIKESFSNLLEVVLLRCRQAGLGVRMGLVETTSSTRAQMKVEFYLPADKSQRVRLSHKVGSLRTWKQSDAAPTGTRALVGGSLLHTPLKVEWVNLTDNRMTTTTNTHTLKTGAKLLIVGPNLPDPLSAGTTYYVIRVDADTIAVAESLTKALNDTEVELTAAGLRVEQVNTTVNSITVTKGDVPLTGARVRMIGSDVPAPLDVSTVYYAIKMDRDTFRVASSLANANAGIEIDLTTTGSGTIHVFEAGSVSLVEVTRAWRQVIDTATETEWGRKIETFVDARTEDPDSETELLERGEAALTEMTAQSGFELEAVEAEGMRLGDHFDVGDTITVELLTGLETTAVLSGVQVEGGSGPITVKFIPGQPDSVNPRRQQAAIIRQLRRDIRQLQREEG